eukprot:CAMPEP_0174732504 /NCGR_PEP_ID=MMETSP1094-20130205/59527_1 /TAXON_ID=156173 /ORGANISM="Chrysochromulina brevifilum, Strain UTEX LB 985" /LENGTH=31 /DNA_ID= /DNA_START= /DNA_END= /DNA_ORIENTATION=
MPQGAEAATKTLPTLLVAQGRKVKTFAMRSV